MDSFKIPENLGLALAMNSEARQKFAALPDEKKWQVVSGTHAVETKEEMQQYVQNIISAY